MKKFIEEFRSEKGAASVLEATIVFPLVFLVVVFLVFLGFTYAQQGLLQYNASRLASYIAKTIQYPGYDKIEEPFFDRTEIRVLTLEEFDAAMKQNDPYRYLKGLFVQDYCLKKEEYERLSKNAVEKMAPDYLSKHGILKPGNVSPAEPSEELFPEKKSDKNKSGGTICVISADTSKVRVYLAQTFTFANFFRMIGVGGKVTNISGQSTAFINDSTEFVRNVDMVFDATNFLAKKLDIDVSKITETIKKLKGEK